MKSLRIFIYVLFILFATGAPARAQCVPASTVAGALDTCFDGDGRVTTQISAGVDIARAMVVQPDGKIVAAGVADYFNSNQNSDFALVRYNADGSLDTTFDGDGIVVTDFSTGSLNDRDEIQTIALQPDGKIVVAGYTTPNTNNYAFAVARYNTDGSLDTSFDGDGRAVWDLAGNIDWAHGVAIQTDGKIIVAGESRSDRAYSIVVRFNPNGSLDNTFDTDGWVVIDEMRDTNAVALTKEGRIIVAGAQSQSRMGVACLNTNGSLFPFFGTNGVGTYSAANVSDEAFAMAIRVDGSIFVAGPSNTGSNTCGSLVRFRGDGVVGVSYVTCDENDYKAITIQSDLKVVTAGSGWNPQWGFTIRRHIEALYADTTFGTSGRVQVKFTPGNATEASYVEGIAMQRDNKIVAAGVTWAHPINTTAKFAVARLYSGLLAPHAERFDFDGDGKADVSVFRPSENRWYVFRSSDLGVTEVFFGQSNDRPVPADYDGDGKTDFAIFRNGGAWRWLSSISGTEEGFQWGGGGSDIPRVSDFNGDGRMDFVIFRPGENIWYRNSITGEFNNQYFGLSGDKPVAGDFDGDGKSDKAIFRPSTGDWWYQSSVNNAQLAVHWGISTDVPAAGDYDGDGKTDFAVYRPETGVWYIINSSNFSFTIVNFGIAEDKPVPADYDGDGKIDIAVFRPSTGVWYLLRSTAGFAAMQFGVSTDIPTPHAYIF